jgi:two-component system OmpR family response regulator
MIKAILLEDDQEICETLTRYAKDYQIDITAFHLPQTALNWLEKEPFDILILDLTLPEMDGLEVCRVVREKYAIPIIIVSARATIGEKILGLEIGADDYLPKPFDPREFVARVKALVRTVKRVKTEQSSNAKFHIDEARHAIYMDEQKLPLTMAEYEVLRLLINAKGNVLSRDTIADNCDSMKWESSAKSVDVIISRIRSKMGDNAKDPQYIFVVKGLGYKFSA